MNNSRKSVLLLFLVCLYNNNLAYHQCVKDLISQYQRPFTLLDLGDIFGTFYSFDIATEYPDSVCVILSMGPNIILSSAVKLIEKCRDRELGNIILLDYVPAVDLQRFSDAEHFDITLALHIIGNENQTKKAFVNAMLNMGDYVIFGVQLPRDLYIEDYLIKKGARKVEVEEEDFCKANYHFYLLATSKNCLYRKTYLYRDIRDNPPIKIISNFQIKSLTKTVSNLQKITVVAPWHPGINLITYMVCGGLYPSRESIKESIRAIANVDHDDWAPYNMILQGKNIMLVDLPHRPDRRKIYEQPSELVRDVLTFVEIKDSFVVERYFKVILSRLHEIREKRYDIG
ncbi:hypothetical protein KC460_04860 [Candidatus Dependentiae bacterium]|nr:hypothetical protein [Candidatus Dependentiae bacterium]